jgi:ribokinase
MPPDAKDLGDLLARVDVLVPNRTELAQLAGLPEPRTEADVDQCVAALGFDKTLVVTLGPDGAVIYTGSRRVAQVPASDVEAIDTSGAGDAFCGGLAHHLALGAPMEGAVRRATELAGRSTTVRGARLPAP